MANLHPDLAEISAIPRTQQLLAMLPRFDRSGMRSLNLVLPQSMASRLKAEVIGSSTQAVAIITRWALFDLQDQGISLEWTGAEDSPYRLIRGVSHPLIDASGRKAGNDIKAGHQSILASLPPLTHQALRSNCSGSLRAVVMTALEYGIYELDRRDLTLTVLQNDGHKGVIGRVIVDSSEPDIKRRIERLAQICHCLCWLGYDAMIFNREETYSENDIIVCIGAVNTEEYQSFSGRVLEAPEEWGLSDDPALRLLATTEDFTTQSPKHLNSEGEDVMAALSNFRLPFCDNCGCGVKGTHLTRVFVPSTHTPINLCGHCVGMHKV